MKRLIKKADAPENIVEDVKVLLDRIDEASDNLKDVYYALFDNLNALFQSYPNLYKQMQMVIKLPTNEEAADVVQFNNDLHQALEHFKDEQYLLSYIDINSNKNILDENQTNKSIPDLPKQE